MPTCETCGDTRTVLGQMRDGPGKPWRTVRGYYVPCPKCVCPPGSSWDPLCVRVCSRGTSGCAVDHEPARSGRPMQEATE